jgi:hypothetical protein
MSTPTVLRTAATGPAQPVDRAGSAGLAESTEPAVPAGLAVLARSRWPDQGGEELPAIAGFVTSSFSPLAAALAERCLVSYFGSRPADPARGDCTAIVLASPTGDLVTATAIASAVDEGRRVPPLLFFQSNPNAVAGHIAARWGLAGPVVCTIPAGDALADAIGSATLLIEDAAATAALIIVAHAGRSDDTRGVALLLGPQSWPAAATPRGDAASPVDTGNPGVAAPAQSGARTP